ncbi:MAG: L,D-transpeptidase, partial [Clostridia bacterium]|nr:L,D-transpeptidase [Clostridia bacterium]
MTLNRVTRPALLVGLLGILAACASEPHQYAQPTQSSKTVPAEYQARNDDGKEIPAVNPKYLVERNRRQIVPY